MVKKQKCSKGCFDEMRFTEKHETGKAIKRKVSKSHFSEIRDTKKHEAVMAEKHETVYGEKGKS